MLSKQTGYSLICRLLPLTSVAHGGALGLSRKNADCVLGLHDGFPHLVSGCVDLMHELVLAVLCGRTLVKMSLLPTR